MDRLIRYFDVEEDGDLMLCRTRGVAYQRDMSRKVAYDAAYFDKCRGYEDKEIARRINAGRVAIVNKHAGLGKVLDVGVGSGEFIRNRGDTTFGYDVNPAAIAWLKQEGRWSEDFGAFQAFTFWDVLEHIEDPQAYFQAMQPGSLLFTCLPIFDDLVRVRVSKHYRPGEHLYYWTRQGFIDWMALWRFRLIEEATFEIEAGREAIRTFAFRRDLPGYHDTLGQYQTMHGAVYGASSGRLYFDLIAPEVLRVKPKSILDFGCGHSDLVAHFWADGARRIARYDPAVPAYKRMPEGEFDIVICNDVMEHILLADVDVVLAEMRQKSARALFTISMRPARAKLPDGRNAHVTLLSPTEWMRVIGARFDNVVRLPTPWSHILMLRTG